MIAPLVEISLVSEADGLLSLTPPGTVTADKARRLLPLCNGDIIQHESATPEEVNNAIVRFEPRKHKHRLQAFICKVMKAKGRMDSGLLLAQSQKKMLAQGLELELGEFNGVCKELMDRGFITMAE